MRECDKCGDMFDVTGTVEVTSPAFLCTDCSAAPSGPRAQLLMFPVSLMSFILSSESDCKLKLHQASVAEELSTGRRDTEAYTHIQERMRVYDEFFAAQSQVAQVALPLARAICDATSNSGDLRFVVARATGREVSPKDVI